MSEVPRRGMLAVAAREWWLVIATAAAAGLIAFVASGSTSSTYVGTALVKVNQPVVSRYPTMLYGDRMLDVLESSEFRADVASSAGMSTADVSKNFRATATGKLLDRLNVRYSADSASRAEEGTTKLAEGIVSFAIEFNSPELERLKAIADSGDAAVKRVRDLKARIGDDPYQQADIEAQLTVLEQSAITNRSYYELASDAYSFDGRVSVEERAGSRSTDLVAAAVLAGLVAGLVLAAVRERLLSRAAAA